MTLSRLLPHHFSKFPSLLLFPTCCLAAKKISEFSMEKGKYPEDERDHMREVESAGKAVCESNSTKMNNISDHIMPHLLNLYGSCATSHDFEIYHVDASFEDPLMCAHGVKQIKSAFYSLSKVSRTLGSPTILDALSEILSKQFSLMHLRPQLHAKYLRVFSESRIVEYSVTEKEISTGKQEILIDNKQQYKFLGRNIDMISLIRLYVEDGKVIRHEDWWNKKPLQNRETVGFPLVGRMMELTRRGSMLATHALMGFGRDPSR